MLNKLNNPTARVILYVIFLGGIIGMIFFANNQMNKKYDTGYDLGRLEYQKEINDYIVKSLTETGELKIRYQSTETGEATDIVLIIKQ